MTTPTTTRNVLPQWAETLRQKYLAGEASTFVRPGALGYQARVSIFRLETSSIR